MAFWETYQHTDRMTQMGSISNNHLSVTCQICGHHSMIAVSRLLEGLHWTEKLDSVRARLTCQKCKARGRNSVQIIYVGASGEAMLGASAKRRPRETGRVSEER